MKMNKTVVIKTRITPADFTEAKRIADAMNMSVSELVRHALIQLAKKVKVK